VLNGQHETGIPPRTNTDAFATPVIYPVAPPT